MSEKSKPSSNEKFDPEKHKELQKGPLKAEHKNQYGTKGNKITERDLAQRVPDKKK